jgi:uncharacterized Zn finger protein (UPF0148 family)
MSVYGNTCPMCCGDLDLERTGATACPSCGCNTDASASTARQPDVMASGVSAVTGISPLQDIQMQTSASAALTELITR